jgi:hypothetical protein
MQKSTLVAIDTNFPLMLAEGNDIAVDALSVVRERVRPAEILIPPTALAELNFHAKNSPALKLRTSARTALENLHSRWHFHPADLNSAQEASVAEAARRILFSGLLPPEERNDAAIIAESAVLNSILLVSNDSHLLKADHRRLGLLFRELDLPVPLIISPREIVRKFYR